MAYFKAGILGFSGSGKTFTATLLAEGICQATGNKTVAYFDTETGSDFLLPRLEAAGITVYQTKSRAFVDLLTVIHECEQMGVGVLIIDSITHVWRDLCDSYDKKLHRNGRMQFQDWLIIKGEWREYTDAYINSKVHIIVCGRAGYEYDYDFNEDGSKDLIKTDVKMKVESEFGFEPSLVILMERTSETKDEIKEFIGRSDRKAKDAKASHRPEIGSKWIHRAYVLKDRTDTLNGQIFDYPTFENFQPHFSALNIGGTHLGVDTTRTSEDRFTVNGKPQWKERQDLAQIALEEIEAEVVRAMPGQTVGEKQAKINLLFHVFGTASWKAIQGMHCDILQSKLKELRAILSNSENTPENMSKGQFAPLSPSPLQQQANEVFGAESPDPTQQPDSTIPEQPPQPSESDLQAELCLACVKIANAGKCVVTDDAVSFRLSTAPDGIDPSKLVENICATLGSFPSNGKVMPGVNQAGELHGVPLQLALGRAKKAVAALANRQQ